MKHFFALATLLVLLCSAACFGQTAVESSATTNLRAEWASDSTAADSAATVLRLAPDPRELAVAYGGGWSEQPQWLQAASRQVQEDRKAEVEPEARHRKVKSGRAQQPQGLRCSSPRDRAHARRVYTGMGYGRPGGRR